MPASRFLRLSFFLVAPFFLGLALLAIWMATSASVENYRVGRASQQVTMIVARARDMRVLPSAAPERAQAALIDYLVEYDDMKALPDTESHQPEDPTYGIKDPWGDLLRVFVYPPSQALRFEVPLSASGCRKLLSSYARDAGSIGLQRVDIREHLPSALWRLVYEMPAGSQNASIQESAVLAGCTGHGEKVVSLTFKM